uniref:Kinesin heavy chain n=1 Tax=Solanum tuberosum TaxID=4113 RepID=M1DE76_SOLTU
MAASHISPVNISITSNKGNIFCNHNISSPHETMGQQVAASTQAVKLALVTVSADGQRAIVEDTLKESTSLTDVAYPEQNDSYSTNYTTRYRRSRHHDHFKKFATKEESLQNIPTNVNEAEWKFLVDYFSSDDFKDKVKDVVAEKIQGIEEGTDVDPIINAAFVQIMGEKSKYILGPGFGIKPASKISRNEIQEQLQAQQKEAKEEHRKRESVENKQMEVKNQLEEERKNREVMEARLVRDQKLLKETVMALTSHLQNSKQTQESDMQKELDNLKDNLTFEKQNLDMAAYDCDKFRSLCDAKDAKLKVAQMDKRNLEMHLSKLSSQGLNKNISKELVEANNQVLETIQEEVKARAMLRTAEETKRKLLNEKSSLEKLEKRKSSEMTVYPTFPVNIANLLVFTSK